MLKIRSLILLILLSIFFIGCETTCDEGFEGDDCKINIDDCKDNPCKNESECIDKTANYICICKDGYEGKDCEIDIDDCKDAPCLNDGICTDKVASFSCECKDGYSGDNCELWSNQWGITYEEYQSGSFIVDMTIDDNKNLYLVDFIPHKEGSSSFFKKINNQNEELWSKALGDSFQSKILSYNEFIYVVSLKEIYNEETRVNNDYIYLTKYSLDGEIIWTKRFTSESLEMQSYTPQFAIDSKGNIYIISYESYPKKIVLVKFNDEGELLFTKDMNLELFTEIKSLKFDKFDNILLLGDVSNNGFLTKLDNKGNELWNKSLNNKGYSLTIGFNNNYYITGVKNYKMSASYTITGDAFISKFNQDGEEKWSKYLSEEEDDSKFSEGMGIVRDSENYIYTIALTDIIEKRDEDIKSNLLISKYHPSGTLQWKKSYKDINIYDISPVLLDSDKKIYIGGSSVRAEKVGDLDAFIMKIDTSMFKKEDDF